MLHMLMKILRERAQSRLRSEAAKTWQRRCCDNKEVGSRPIHRHMRKQRNASAPTDDTASVLRAAGMDLKYRLLLVAPISLPTDCPATGCRKLLARSLQQPIIYMRGCRYIRPPQ